MSDKEILGKNIDLDNSCLNRWEKRKVRQLIHNYKDAFSLRDEIGTCPNIEVADRSYRQKSFLYKSISC